MRDQIIETEKDRRLNQGFNASAHAGFQLRFAAEAREIAIHGRRRQRALCQLVRDGAVLAVEATVDLHDVPFFSMPDVLDGNIELTGPEERHGIESLASPEHVS